MKQIQLDYPDGETHTVVVKALKYSNKYNCDFIYYIDNGKKMYSPLIKVNGKYYKNPDHYQKMIDDFAFQTYSEILNANSSKSLDDLPEHIYLATKEIINQGKMGIPQTPNTPNNEVRTNKGIEEPDNRGYIGHFEEHKNESKQESRTKIIIYFDDQFCHYIDKSTLSLLKKIMYLDDDSIEEMTKNSPYDGLYKINEKMIEALQVKYSVYYEKLLIVYFDIDNAYSFVSSKIAEENELEAINGLYQDTYLGKLYMLSENDLKKLESIGYIKPTYRRYISHEGKLTMPINIVQSDNESKKYVVNHVALNEAEYYKNDSSNYYYVDLESLKQYLETHKPEIVTSFIDRTKTTEMERK